MLRRYVALLCYNGSFLKQFTLRNCYSVTLVKVFSSRLNWARSGGTYSKHLKSYKNCLVAKKIICKTQTILYLCYDHKMISSCLFAYCMLYTIMQFYSNVSYFIQLECVIQRCLRIYYTCSFIKFYRVGKKYKMDSV